MTTTPSSSFERAQQDLERVKPFLLPVTAADIQERLWEHARRLEEAAAEIESPSSPMVAQPRRLPRPLNPLFFMKKP